MTFLNSTLKFSVVMSINLCHSLFSDSNWHNCPRINNCTNIGSDKKRFITQEKPWILRILHKHSFIRVLTIPFNLFTVANSHYNSVDKTKLSSLERLFRPWPSETDLVGTFYETRQNHLVDFLTLLHKLQRETSPKNLLKPLPPFCDLHTRKADAYQRLLTFFCVACAKKCLYAVLLNANNIRLLTKCDAALLSFRYTSTKYT